MIDTVMVVTTVAVTDLDVAREFYETRLGLTVLDNAPFAIRFGVAGSQISVRRGQPNVGQTVAHFEVTDLDAVMQDLRGRGITFEEYEAPRTVNGVAQIGPARAAWFKDPDGNIFGLREGPVPAAA
ncbi:MAG TPA: VOC family protein [Candidatus Limnocylindrales bacterium]|jgi:catechol 2,3-dioxygenase-like lactoylglutathione lyase family enzyme